MTPGAAALSGQTGQLDKVIANLGPMPLRMNESKNAKVGSRQFQKADELHRAGLLCKDGLAKVRSAMAPTDRNLLF